MKVTASADAGTRLLLLVLLQVGKVGALTFGLLTTVYAVEDVQKQALGQGPAGAPCMYWIAAVLLPLVQCSSKLCSAPRARLTTFGQAIFNPNLDFGSQASV